MTRTTHPLARLSLGLGGVALGLGATVPALASGGPTTVAISSAASVVTGGDITPGNFGTIDLAGTRTSTASFAIGNVVDQTGTGNGWRVALTLPPLAEYANGGYVLTGHTLPVSSVTVLTVPTAADASGDGTSSPASDITTVAVNAPLDGVDGGVTVLDAGVGKGMGIYSFTSLGVRLHVPARTFKATYRSDATVSLTNAP